MSKALETDSSAPALGLSLVLAATVSISFSNILTPMVYALGTSIETLLVLRLVCFLSLCAFWLRVQGVPFRLGRRQLLHCLGAGTAYMIGSGGLIASFFFMPVSLAILIFYMFPLITRLGESLIDRRPPSWVEIICFIAALAGLVLCLGVGLEALNTPGLLFAIVAACGISVSFLWSGRKLSNVQSTVSTFYMAGTGLILVLGATAVTGRWTPPPVDTVSLLIIAATALTFAGAFFGMFASVRLIGPSRAAMIMNLEPVLTIALAVFLLSEDFSLHQVAGASLVIVAIVVAQAVRR
ncbi:DMT family transporter [Hoeflea prorocentri]|uniref:DMT family transporter n=1 Tax=Hoeflea prorocentri TaxID=1922333 RepID=A0A9X3UQJ3_9HYPH|nr:DMT family transporter [Hoeflea prorocentri]MCY6383376.1 DMT family transporter [Hoeflea prorocentri]MDA5401176.1 DMT family transporter [Hoeflea prorocentri]